MSNIKIIVAGNLHGINIPLTPMHETYFSDVIHDKDNIDKYNPCFCELTGLYYLWKHVDDEIVGLEHYRRYFVNSKNKLLSETEIKKLLETNDIILIKEDYSRRPNKSIISYFDKCRTTLEIQKFLIFIKHFIGNDFYDFCIKYMNGNWHALGNMFIAKKKIINEYCSYIFDLTFTYMEAEKSFGRKIPKRMIGYFTEFLFGAWAVYNKKKITFGKIKFVR